MTNGVTRRDVLRTSALLAGGAVAGAGAAVPPQASAAPRRSVRANAAKSCIIIYCWGGISHYESFDPKPHALSEVRGEFGDTATATPGIRFCEHLPMLAKHTEKLAVVRSLHHTQGGHQQGMYVSLTGHSPAGGLKAKNAENWPSLPAMISRFRQRPGVPLAIRVPYSMYDNGALMAGEYGGWLGSEYDPVLMKTPKGKPFAGVSRYTSRELELKLNLQRQRILDRQSLSRKLEGERAVGAVSDFERMDQFREMASEMLIDSPIKDAYDLESEDLRLRAMYGDHIGGQSMLLARRMVEAGVPVVQVCAGAGDLAGGSGDNWDTHRDHFTKMKNRLLPVFDRSVSALLADLEQRGMLEETLVVVLTDFGRTPKINNNGGRDHYPACYSTILAGGGIRGGQVHGASDANGMKPADAPCSPADLHATVYQAMGIDPHVEVHDQSGRPYQICDGQPLPLL